MIQKVQLKDVNNNIILYTIQECNNITFFNVLAAKMNFNLP